MSPTSARRVLVAVAVWLLAAGLILAATVEHLSVGHVAAPVLVAVGGGLLVRIYQVKEGTSR